MATSEYNARYRETHREEIRAGDRRRYRQRAAVDPEHYREESRRWREANPEKKRAAALAWYHRNKERAAEAKRAYRAAHPEIHAESSHRRRARMHGAEVVEKIDRDAIIARDKSRCHLCGKRVDRGQLVLDHIVPLSLGGEHSARNLAVAHRSCNASKGVRARNEQLRLVG